jgi:sec-independent protein translocase protein TatA
VVRSLRDLTTSNCGGCLRKRGFSLAFDGEVGVGAMSWMHWVAVAMVAAVLLGGGGRLSGLMGDAARGVRAFKAGLRDDDERRGA